MLFDLDGTLSDSASGILASLRRAFADHGLQPLTAEQERSILGPPFTKTLPRYVAADQVADVIATYRGYYSARGMFETSVYPGIPELLSWLHERGVAMAVATSKIEPFAVPIVDRLGLTRFVATIGGDDFEASRDSKALVVGEVLRRLGHPDPSTVLMVGDRVHDVDGAAAHGVGCLGAGWGYGTPEELSGALSWHRSPAELLATFRCAGPRLRDR